MNIAFITTDRMTALCFGEFFEILPNRTLTPPSSSGQEDYLVTWILEKASGQKRSLISPTSAAVCKLGVTILASGEAVDVFKRLNIDFTECNPTQINLSETSQERSLLCIDIAKYLSSLKTSIAMTGVSSPFDTDVQRTLSQHSPCIKRVCFYNSFKEFIPGYSKTAAEVMKACQKGLCCTMPFRHRLRFMRKICK